MRGKARWTGLMEFRHIGKLEIMSSGCRKPTSGRARGTLTTLILARIKSIAWSSQVEESFLRMTIETQDGVSGRARTGMNWGAKNFHQMFAIVSLCFALLVAGLLPFPTRAATTTSSLKREAASSQFARAEELRGLLNSKAPDQRTLSEYKKVVAGYQRVYMITPHAAEVSDALFAVAELNTEMGDRFGRSYYQTAADTYTYLIRDYPSSRHAQDAMLRLADLQKDLLGDLTAATKTYQEFAKKYPKSAHKREVQEDLAELALRKSAETGEVASKNSAAPTIATAVKSESTTADIRRTVSGGEAAKSVAVPRVQKIRTNMTTDSTEVIIDLEDSVQYA